MQAITTPSGYVRWAGEVPATFSCPNTFPATDYWCFSVRNKGRLTSPLLGQCIVNVNWAPDGGAYYSYAGYRSENHNPQVIRAPPNTTVDLWVPLEASGGRGKLRVRMKATWKYGHSEQAPSMNWRDPGEVEAWLAQLNVERNAAATKIQAHARGYLARRSCAERRATMTPGAVGSAVAVATEGIKKGALRAQMPKLVEGSARHRRKTFK